MKQKPVAWRAPHWSGEKGVWVYRDYDEPFVSINGNNVGEPLYAAPRELSDEEITAIWHDHEDWEPIAPLSFARAILKKASEL